MIVELATALHGSDQMVQIFPASKEWYGADGRGPYRLSNPHEVVERSKAIAILDKAMVDREHARQLAPAGTPVKAAGWFKDYEVREDGSVWGRIEWTPAAKEELSNKEFRFFSGTFRVNKPTREITAITGGTITNDPNFELQALASKEKLTLTQSEEIEPMKEEFEALAKALGLDPEKAEEKDILAAAQERIENQEGGTEHLASLRKLFKLDDDADLASIVKAASKTAEEIASKKDGDDVDPEKYVPKEMYDELATRMDKLENDTASSKASEAVEQAIKDGKIAPAMKDWAENYASKNLEGFREFLGKQPKIIGDETAAAKARTAANGGLSDEDLEVAKQLGNDPEKLKVKQDKGEEQAA